MDLQLSKSLYRWALNKPENRDKLETWLEDALEQMAAGKGKEVANTSANGVSVAFQAGTVADWFSTLSQALTYLDSKPVTKIQGRVN